MVQMQVRSQTAQVGVSTTTSTNTAPTQLSLTVCPIVLKKCIVFSYNLSTKLTFFQLL